MEFDLSKPQQLLRDTARDFFEHECPPSKVRDLMAGASAFDAGLWRAIADQGWINLHLAESDGGLGLSLVEMAVVTEEMGRACLPGPFLATLWATTLLAKTNDDARCTRYLEAIAAGDLRATVALLEPEASWDKDDTRLQVEACAAGYRLDGRKIWVLDAADAGLIVCIGAHQGQLMILPVAPDAAGVTLTSTPALDATRKVYQVDFAGVVVPASEVLASGDPARAALDHSLQVATVAICAELVGIAQKSRSG